MIIIILSLQLSYKNKVYDLKLVNTETAEYVCFSSLMSDIGIPYLYDKVKRSFIFQKEKSLTIYADNPFIKVDDKFIQLFYSPIELNSELYIEKNEFLKVLSIFTNSRFKLQNDMIVEERDYNIRSFKFGVSQDETTIIIEISPSMEVLYKGRDTLWSITFFDPVYDPSIFNTKSGGFVKKIETYPKEGILELRIIVDEKKDVNIRKTDNEIRISIKNIKKRVIKNIVLDPGHGGQDLGGVGNGLYEKDVVLDIAKRVANELKKMGFSVTLTRTDDIFLSLKERTEIADNMKADLFVSIHCNAVGNKSKIGMNGTEVYFLSVAKTDWARAVEATENSSIQFENGKIEEKSLKYVLWDLAQNQFLVESQQLAIDIQESIVNECGTTNRGVQQANFYVLRLNYMPAVLIETLFITNPDDAKKLKDKNFLDKLAKSIAKGIKNYADRFESQK
uniref:N-acetylmuramoyl-L-alanine amidase n=1 Tax=candidate division WOR-3 bacterium TaxID=2052148 RepID=A0A7C4YC70_UNCW3